jgi:Saxitoxin biosynthesis operon protein SxtJ
MEARTRHVESALVITAGMLLLYAAWGWMGFVWIALGVALVGAFVPVLARYLHTGWTALGHILGWANGNIILALLFYVVMTPMAALRRLVAKDTLQRKRRADGSYLTDRDHLYVPKDLQDLW